MTKRIAALFLALLVILSLASCGKKNKDKDDKKTDNTEENGEKNPDEKNPEGDNPGTEGEGNKDDGKGITASEGEGYAEDIDWNDFIEAE